jgi:hypothetical protein
MTLPFTIDQFLGVFEQYNETVWPSQWILNALAIVAVVGAVKGTRLGSRTAIIILATLWVWTGVVYHFVFFRAINPAAAIFGVMFIGEGILIAWLGLAMRAVRFERHLDLGRVTGLALIAYALIVYPLIGYAIGHRYPAAPTFGAPCPTTIFTFGMILLSARPRSRAVVFIPAVWSGLGLSAALQLGMLEDLGLIAAAAVTVGFVLMQRRVERRGSLAVAGSR